MISIRWSRNAQSDLAEIDLYYRSIDPDVSRRIGRLAIAATRFLAEYPGAGERFADSQARHWRVAKTPYILIYRLDGNVLRINRLVHGTSDWRKHR